MKKKGFTLVELLVVIAIIALLMGILMPALARVRQIAFRMVCGTNLSGIGKAMLIYANDYNDEMPRAGGPLAEWSNRINDPLAKIPDNAYKGKATITSSFYLLVKYTDVTPKSFLCKGDAEVREYVPETGYDLVDLWDFGGSNTTQYCSYSYQLPYGAKAFPLTTSSDPGMAVAADPTPWASADSDFGAFNFAGSKDEKNLGNATTHQNEGQNVMFLDTHVNFESVSFCGLNEDNIYTYQKNNIDIRKGDKPSAKNFYPTNRNDSLLLTDKLAPNK